MECVRRPGVRTKRNVASDVAAEAATWWADKEGCMAQARKGAGKSPRVVQWSDSACEHRFCTRPFQYHRTSNCFAIFTKLSNFSFCLYLQ